MPIARESAKAGEFQLAWIAEMVPLPTVYTYSESSTAREVKETVAGSEKRSSIKGL